jgi:dihydrodipicolinate synthase/N-acetylneuraminate lyase
MNRQRILTQLFPNGVPRLWCPPLTHYKRDGTIDADRMAAHLRHLSKHVRGVLVPGSTGDGWELNTGETRRVLEIVLDVVREANLELIIGILKPTAEETLSAMRETVEWLKARAQQGETDRPLAAGRVRGFTICPPRGSGLNQDEIERGLSMVLESGLPIAVYQLPQVTGNEISPEVISRLAERFQNFLMFKDSSGADRVVKAGRELEGVFAMRDAEGDYAKWLKIARGPYDGFLLSTANCFGRELQQMIRFQEAGHEREAEEISERLTTVVNEVFAMVKGLPDGNPFTNANKAMDHFFAWGARAESVPGPRLHAGSHLSAEILTATRTALSRSGFLPQDGYLE